MKSLTWLRTTTVFVGATLLFSACDPATDPVDYGEFVKAEGDGELGVWVHSGLYNRTYFLHTPAGLNQSEGHPLLIFLHGAGDTGKRFHDRLRADDATDAEGFVTVFPDGLEGTWTVGCENCTAAVALKADDVTFLQTLVRQLARNLSIDTTRVYVAGYSQGGSLAHLYACTSAFPPAGIAGVASLVYRNVELDCAPGRPMPVLIIHGTDDPLAYYSGYGLEAPVMPVPQAVDMWVGKMHCDPAPEVSEIPDRVGDFTSVTGFRFTGCTEGSEVLHYRVNGGGHTWPGDTGFWGYYSGRQSRNLDATREMLDFFTSVGGWR